MILALNIILDHLVRHFGRVPGFALFGFLASSMFLLPCCYLDLISQKAALIEAVTASIWMAAASLILLILRGKESEEE